MRIMGLGGCVPLRLSLLDGWTNEGGCCFGWQEETLEVEYIESVMPPERVSDIPHDDWVSSVSCTSPG